MSSTWKYKYFIDVVENKSFTKAGTINYVSQTAISQNISSLEKTTSCFCVAATEVSGISQAFFRKAFTW